MNRIGLSLALVVALLAGVEAEARDIYVSKTTGSNKGPGTKEKPYKLLWKVIAKLEEGDRVHVAEGVYNGQKKSGVMPRLPAGDVHLIGGYKADFSGRDPFTHLTVITGVADRQADTAEVFYYAPSNPQGAKPVVIDGFCIDRGPGLYYSGKGEGGTDVKEGHKDTSCWGYQAINKKKSGSDPAIELLGKTHFVVRNNILINNPWWGISVKAGGGEETVIENNLILGYQGRGIEAIGGGGWGQPKFTIRNNTVAFGTTIEGRALSLDPRKSYSGGYTVEKNVLAGGAQMGIATKFGAETLAMNNNLFFGFTQADFGDGGSPTCNAGEFEDELECDNEGNVHEVPKFFAKVPQAWFDRWSQWKGHTSKFFTSDEVMAARKACGLGAYELPFFPGKTYESYDKLPGGRINFCMSRFPKPFKEGEALMDWKVSVLPMIGADGERVIQPFKK